MISAVIFDVGGVLVRTEDHSRRRMIEQRLGLQSGDAEELVFNEEMGVSAQLGQITTEQLWAWLKKHLQLDDAGLTEFRREFFGGDRLDTGLVDYVRSLRSRYQTAIISNASDDLLDTLTTTYPIADAFDLIVGSAYEGVMKPDAVIFERTLKRLGRQPGETVFIDDFSHNVEGARAVGMHALHYKSGTDLVMALAKLGVTPHSKP
jgi:epoxide hydrolase-like predicted phosphatase